MRVWQPGGHLTHQRGAKVEDWSWRQTRRRLATLARLTSPYKGRTALALGSLLAATATALLPPYLAKLAIDDGIRKEDLHALTLIVIAFLIAGVCELGGLRTRRPTSPAGPASASSPTCGRSSSAISSDCRSASTSGTAPA